ncbi:MAG: F0F1 ATP synthase subunit A [Thermodesulfobacteriota bacterium]
MQHPLLFISVILDAIGLPAQGGESFLAQALAPHMQYSYMAIALTLILGKMGTSKREMVPTGMQNVMELFVGGLEDFITQQVGDREKARMLFPMIATFGYLILISNYLGLVPGFTSPTANLNITLAYTAIVIVSYHALGIRYHGFKYIKHFMGPIKVMAPFFLVVETFSHIGRILSLSIRLFGNMMSKELLLFILFTLAGQYLAPLPIMLLGVLVCTIQAFIFVVLPVSYCAEAMHEPH